MICCVLGPLSLTSPRSDLPGGELTAMIVSSAACKGGVPGVTGESHTRRTADGAIGRSTPGWSGLSFLTLVVARIVHHFALLGFDHLRQAIHERTGLHGLGRLGLQ